MKFLSLTIQIKKLLSSTSFDSVDEILKCDHSNESYWAVWWKWIYEISYIWTAEERMNKWMIIGEVIYAT